MSEPRPPQDQHPYRRIIKQLAGALLIGAAGLAIVATAVPFEAAAKPGGGGNGLDPDVEDMKEAFENWLGAVEDMTELFVESDTFTQDEAHSVGAYDLITGFIQSNNRANMGSSGSGRGRPRFAGFDDPDTRIGVDNPDTQYMGVIVDNSDCSQIWRVWGNRGNTVDFILTTFDTSAGTGGGPTLEDEDMVNMNGNPLQLNEDWEAYAACPEIIDQHPEWLNTLELPVSERLQIARRHTHCDWNVEHPEEVHIERLGTEGVPSPPLSAAVMAKQIDGATARPSLRRAPSGRRSSHSSSSCSRSTPQRRGSPPATSGSRRSTTCSCGSTPATTLRPRSSFASRIQASPSTWASSSATSGDRRLIGPTGT
jgi:hypothetical protein